MQGVSVLAGVGEDAAAVGAAGGVAFGEFHRCAAVGADEGVLRGAEGAVLVEDESVAFADIAHEVALAYAVVEGGGSGLSVDGEALREVGDGVEVLLCDSLHDGEFLIHGCEARPHQRGAVEAEHGAYDAEDEQGDEALVVAHVYRAEDYAGDARDESQRQYEGESEVSLFGF